VTDPGTTQDPGNGSGGGESRLYMFDVSGEKHLWSVRIDGTDLVDHGYIAGAKSAPYAFYLSPDGGHALFKDDGIQHLDLKTGQLTAFSAMPGIIGVFSPDSTRVLSLGWGGEDVRAGRIGRRDAGRL
jgi:hypothetical protein